MTEKVAGTDVPRSGSMDPCMAGEETRKRIGEESEGQEKERGKIGERRPTLVD